jgi:hypothetical protein
VGSKLNGAIQEMTLWDRARSMAEAQGDMYTTKAASTPYLIGYWKFDEGEGVKAADHRAKPQYGSACCQLVPQ